MTDDTHASAEEKRALSRDEQELADRARQPALGDLSDGDLSGLVSLLRERRNRARDIGDRQGREARGKASPSGATPAGGNEGTRSKADFLDAALNRAMAERDSRGNADSAGQADEPEQVRLAKKAMALKQAGQKSSPMLEDGGALHPNDPDASKGKKGLADTARETAPSGALDHAGELPSRERSRTRY